MELHDSLSSAGIGQWARKPRAAQGQPALDPRSAIDRPCRRRKTAMQVAHSAQIFECGCDQLRSQGRVSRRAYVSRAPLLRGVAGEPSTSDGSNASGGKAAKRNQLKARLLVPLTRGHGGAVAPCARAMIAGALTTAEECGWRQRTASTSAVKRYPAPRSVRINWPPPSVFSILRRSLPIWTSMARS